MSNIMIDHMNKIATAAKALEDALNDYGGIVDVEVGRDGTQSVWASESVYPYSYKVALSAGIYITEDGEAAFAGRDPGQSGTNG